MKDLDFDELDRAVNSLMTDASKPDAPKTEPEEKTLDITPTLGKDSAPSFDKLSEATAKMSGAPTPPSEPAQKPASEQPAAAKLEAPAPRPSTPPATRRGGRFMDVVHPSADMKKPAAPERAKVSRQGVTIAPSPAMEAAAPAPLAVPTPSPKPEDTETETLKTEAPALQPSAAAPEHPAQKSDWPDPLEMADFKDEPEPAQKPVEPEKPATDEPLTETPQQETTAETKDETAPLTSPFLSDAKVEKRPLGGAPATAEEPGRAPVLGEKAGEELALADPEAQLPASPVPEAEPELPEELKGDLVQIEADTTTHKKTENPENSLFTEKTPGTKPEAVAATPTPPEKPPVAAPKEEKPVPTGPTSIAQQYREEPSTGDQDNGAIYDTDTYHQPLAHPAKKKSGWLWVLWIVIILLLGAGGGAALYLLGVM